MPGSAASRSSIEALGPGCVAIRGHRHDPRTTTEDRPEGRCQRSWPEPRDVYVYVI